MAVEIGHERWQPSMREVSKIGLDIAMHVFHVQGVDGAGEVVIRREADSGWLVIENQL